MAVEEALPVVPFPGASSLPPLGVVDAGGGLGGRPWRGRLGSGEVWASITAASDDGAFGFGVDRFISASICVIWERTRSDVGWRRSAVRYGMLYSGRMSCVSGFTMLRSDQLVSAGGALAISRLSSARAATSTAALSSSEHSWLRDFIRAPSFFVSAAAEGFARTTFFAGRIDMPWPLKVVNAALVIHQRTHNTSPLPAFVRHSDSLQE
jgi:hypothetical protein